MESKVVWKDGMAFEAHLDGFTLTLDASPEVGGRGLGPKPKGLTLASLAGCTGMDVVAILGKMRVPFASFEVSADGELAAEHPKKFDAITLTYRFTGEELPLKKLRRAVTLSQDRYCGVSATLAPAVRIDSRLVVNGEALPLEDDA